MSNPLDINGRGIEVGTTIVYDLTQYHVTNNESPLILAVNHDTAGIEELKADEVMVVYCPKCPD